MNDGRDGKAEVSGSLGAASEARRRLPAVGAVLAACEALDLIGAYGRAAVTAAARAELAQSRAQGGDAPGADEFARRAAERLKGQATPSLRAVFNLTGTVLHTNLGRAALAEAAIEAAAEAMREAVSLEYDLATGRRGERDDHIRALICELTGAEDATVVNNNAAAVLLALNAFAGGREAVVSRGELIEIGGAFRMPDIMARAGCRLVEVGTTNRTHARDYRAAIGADTGVILKVHTSNYRIEGFTAEVSVEELAAIANAAGVALLNDLGSGTLVDLRAFGLAREPTVREALAQGAGVVTFSGDKLLGGPQAGFIAGRRALIAAINANPLKRALRVDKIRLAAIEATLKLYRDPDRIAQRLPTLRLLSRPREDIAEAAQRLRAPVQAALGPAFSVETCACLSQVGSGASPLDTIPSAGLAMRARDGSGAAPEALAARFRALSRPVIGRVAEDALRFDLRCLEDEPAFLAEITGLRTP